MGLLEKEDIQYFETKTNDELLIILEKVKQSAHESIDDGFYIIAKFNIDIAISVKNIIEKRNN